MTKRPGRSTGPRSTAGKAIAAQNARKHGLFRTTQPQLEQRSAAVRRLASALEEQSPAKNSQTDWALDRAVTAAQRLEEASHLVSALRSDLCERLADATANPHDLLALLQRLLRMSRYERRFRGQRDRAIRTVLAGTGTAQP